MKLGSMLKEGNFERYLKEGRQADESENRNRKIFERGSAFIKKFKVEENKKHAILYPLELTLPFNPMSLEDTSVNDNNPFIFPGSVSDAIVFLKVKMNEDESFKEAVLSALSLKPDEVEKLNLADTETVSVTEGRLWHRLCRPYYITGYVQTIKGISDKFARKMGCVPVFDEMGTIVGSKGIGYHVNLLENELLALQIEEVNKQYSAGGEYADRSDDDRKTAIDSLRANRIISNPYLQAFTRVFAIPERNSEGNLESSVIEGILKSKKLTAHDFYLKMTKEINDLIVSNLGSKNYDNSIDFMELRLDVPEKDPKDNMSIYKAKPVLVTNAVSIFNPENTSQEFIDTVLTAYRTIVGDTTAWNSDILRRSVNELRLKSDSDICAIAKNAITKYEIGLKNSGINEKYSELLETIDSELVASFAEAVIDGEANDKEVNRKILEAIPVTSGYGDESDDSLIDGDSLTNEFEKAFNTDTINDAF